MISIKRKRGFMGSEARASFTFLLLAISIVAIALLEGGQATQKLPAETSWLMSVGFFLGTAIFYIVINLLAFLALFATVVGVVILCSKIRNRLGGS